VSYELIIAVFTILGTAVSVFGGVFVLFMVYQRRTDTRLDRIETQIIDFRRDVDARFRDMDTRLRDTNLEMTKIRHEVTANTVAITRIEARNGDLTLTAQA